MTVQLVDVLTNGRNPLPQRFERKYYLVPMKVGLAYGLLRHICLMDSEYLSEQINSLYFDTADLDQHERFSSGTIVKTRCASAGMVRIDTFTRCRAYLSS
jgi:hypothetical protein